MNPDEDAALWGQPYSERFAELRASEVDRLTFALSDARMEIATLREALKKIAEAPAWGAPDKWETTPAEVRQLARAALAKAKQP